MPSKLTLDHVKRWLKNNGCKYLDGGYVNKLSIITFIAACGHSKKLTWHQIIKSYDRCKDCAYDNRNNNNLRIEDIRLLLESSNCKLLSKSIKCCSDYIEYIAQCGHQHGCVYTHFQQGNARICRSCSALKHPSCQNLSNVDVRKRLLNVGCHLISKYSGALNKIEFIASCGHKHIATASDIFQRKCQVICPSCSRLTQGKISKSGIEWLNHIAEEENIIIQHGFNDVEFRVPGTRFSVDGYCKENNTIYEFYGDYWHGNPKLYNSNDLNQSVGKTFGELYDNTISRERKIIDGGFNLIAVWESDWNINKER